MKLEGTTVGCIIVLISTWQVFDKILELILHEHVFVLLLDQLEQVVDKLHHDNVNINNYGGYTTFS